MIDDPVIRRVRDVRHVISEQHGHDPGHQVQPLLLLHFSPAN